ncbi:phosphatidate cytidylyltransferase [Mycoplasma aquilae ATCC BAA-1896]|uniref:phosphatidate cytidylyltransferase n=1 Tax=Mycoplasma aquilae TaxID=1312741 RepID=UPI003A88AA2C
MKTETQERQKNFWLNRFIPALIIVAVLVLLVIVLAYSFRSDLYQGFSTAGFWTLRAFAIVLLGVMVGWIFYELSHAYSNMLIPSVILTIFYVLSMMLGPNMFLEVLFGRGAVASNALINLPVNNVAVNGESSASSYYFGTLFTQYVFDYWAPLTTFIIALVFFLIRLVVIDNVNILALIIKTISLWFMSLFLTIFVKSFIVLMTQKIGIELVILMIVVASSYDIGGYFGGRFLGHKFFKAKLAPAISPKKTWEGAIVGYLASFLITLIYIYAVYGIRGLDKNSVAGVLLDPHSRFFPYLLAFLFISPIIALLGDLYFSLIKRRNEIKDFSNILKEHGGLLDRIDSISFVFVFFGVLAASSTL